MEQTAPGNARPKGARIKKVLAGTGLTIVLIFLLAFLAFKLSPWPSALWIRYNFEKGATAANDALQKHVPPGITAVLDQQYDGKDKDAFLDVYYPAAIAHTGRQLPVIVWIHGGGWLSGRKEDISNYCKILAGKGYVV
ncbi:MAG TPA: hypothetical protein VGC22_05925, partial [Chitinophaga sp.]